MPIRRLDTKTIIKPPYTPSSLRKRVKRTKLIRYPAGHELDNTNLYLVKDFSASYGYRYHGRYKLFARGSIYYTPDDIWTRMPFIVTWRVNRTLIDWTSFKTYKKAERAARGALEVTEGIAEVSSGSDRNVNEWTKSLRKSWVEEYG